jgi:chorismate synthase
VAEVAAAREKPLVCRISYHILNPPGSSISSGRVAAGAIAEKFLKTVYGIEIVAFVSSVGKIHMPSTVSNATRQDEDEAEDALSPEFIRVLKTITREQVDKHLTRCPHPETADKMTQVGYRVLSLTISHSLQAHH